MLTPFVWVLVGVSSRLAVASNASPTGLEMLHEQYFTRVRFG